MRPNVYDITSGHPPLVVGAPTPSGPPARALPSKDGLEYAKVIIELGLLLLAIPWLVRQLAHNPKRVMRGATKHHVGGE